MVESAAKTEAKNYCIRKLSEAGASPELSKFYADAIQYEYDMTHTIYRLQSEMRAEIAKADSLPAEILFRIVQDLTKYFHTWKLRIDSLSKEGIAVPPFQVSMSRPQVFKAVCTIAENEFNLEEGEEAVITDSSHPNWLRVRNSRGEEGYVPAMPCILPTPDNSALTAVERLEILLLTSWTELIRKLKTLLASTLAASSQAMTLQWRTYLLNHVLVGEDRVGIRFKRILDFVTRTPGVVDLNRVHRTLGHIESELLAINSSNGLPSLTATIANLDKAVLCYQTFYAQWRQFRHALKDAPRPIRMVEQWEQLRRASQCRHFKYYEMKMTLEELETHEHISYVNAVAGELMTTSGKFRRESCEADELTSISQEERKRYIIRAVVDPRTNREISFRQAVRDGVVDYRSGMHKNPVTGEGVPIQEAMRIGLIDVTYTSVRLSPPKIDVVALITVRRRVDRSYTLTGAYDSLTGERVDLAEAYRRNILDVKDPVYRNHLDGTTLPLDRAMDDGWVFVDYDDSSPEYDAVTYAIISVMDARAQRPVSFLQAIRRGLIDRDTGNYIDNKTNRRVYVPDAIAQGLIKARRLPKDVNILSIPAENILTIEEPPVKGAGLAITAGEPESLKEGVEGREKKEEGREKDGSVGGREEDGEGEERVLGAGGEQFGYGLVDCHVGPFKG